MERFIYFLHIRKIKPSQEIKMLMKDSKNAGYSVRLMNNLLDHSSPLVFPSRSNWNPIVPPMLGLFAQETS